MAQWKTAKWKRATVTKLIERDGPNCWLCTLPILSTPKKQGRRASIEHLIARSLNGSNSLDNLRLCHDSCNRHLGDRPVAKKWQMRAKWHKAARRNGRAAADCVPAGN